jgi:hypothetical protein
MNTFYTERNVWRYQRCSDRVDKNKADKTMAKEKGHKILHLKLKIE